MKARYTNINIVASQTLESPRDAITNYIRARVMCAVTETFWQVRGLSEYRHKIDPSSKYFSRKWWDVFAINIGKVTFSLWLRQR